MKKILWIIFNILLLTAGIYTFIITLSSGAGAGYIVNGIVCLMITITCCTFNLITLDNYV